MRRGADVETRRCAVWVWYRGGGFAGFVVQPGARTVQATLRAALADAGAPQVVMPAGRTDRGVHARMQVVSMKAPRDWTDEALLAALRARLPQEEVGVCSVKAPSPAFHAQWRAAGKEYRYRLALGQRVPSGWEPYCWHVPGDPQLIARALSQAVGTRDFVAFHEKSSVRRERTVSSAALVEVGDGLFEARLCGDSFARHQVRYLVGAAVLIAQGGLSQDAYAAALEGGVAIGGQRAPAEGLVLWEVLYPSPIDPFGPAEREEAPGVPRAPPFYCVS